MECVTDLAWGGVGCNKLEIFASLDFSVIYICATSNETMVEIRPNAMLAWYICCLHGLQ